MEITTKTSLEEEENSQTVRDKSLKDNGKMVSNKVRDFGKDFMVKLL
jgi:hypothetical protein